MIAGLSSEGSGVLRTVSAAAWGRQDLGHAPGGAQDRAAAGAARAALGLGPDAALLEIVAAPPLRFAGDARFVLTGAPRPDAGLAGRPVPHAQVQRAAAGEILRLGGTRPGGGFRTYLAMTADMAGAWPPLPPLSARRPRASPGVLRLIAGPEWATIDRPSRLFVRPWRVTPDLSDAGLRLEAAGSLPAPRCSPREIVSAPLADGCVQLTPAGPVIFLRGRPTLGGYPRIGCLDEASVDRAAQARPGECVRFENAAGWGASEEPRDREPRVAPAHSAGRAGA
ncbi:5-oxoprolinase subunit C family protein [Phycisphaera mikurensis]|uniref:Carboxyltransferase domain-containing protein n=1 Tax=Phycisphaera mikurensis (strain NBRC 102666 / KCTC 22515 / FYK2301M01) TaxID=1142394 RepID=I0IF35_PHYMF|nr:hypothetical protein [Phycisphaera mikurensis]MBB6440731.1 allophanate hydrolase subunit 2 [Phycisphaera mikurensis]BAM03873.1 hypothetical protein PSMK_17140 [Phycisphaera mikurensis NBRC 102666]